ncbi:RNA methyltransferase [Sulfurovum sp. XGS-02]|uniref:TrmH family RNA methyltransferase n=1 Tax=Sulfurovum sp. XGS-02 TaxID=2925411 RepID=UPI00204DA785|nr:RNA methyltransferase [Sulfurovum sp. XGS-02]UPT76800.1 RNA methyltransferase [Sulfurovum sp. XGS-02]
MNFIHISDINIPELDIYHQLRDKAFTSDNSFIADSPKVVNLLLKTDITVKSILATQEYYDTYAPLIKEKKIPQLFVASKALMQKIVGHKIHHNVMMHGIRPEQTPLGDLDNQIIMLDEISSTQNIGSIARSAAAIGINSYLLPAYGPHPYSRRALRVSMGHISMLKTHLYDDLHKTIMTLKENGYRIYAAEVTDDSTPLASVKVAEKWVLLMGHEGLGLSDEILDLCDEVVTIEMTKGVKSFNVGVAASIMMYQFKHTI